MLTFLLKSSDVKQFQADWISWVRDTQKTEIPTSFHQPALMVDSIELFVGALACQLKSMTAHQLQKTVTAMATTATISEELFQTASSSAAR